ncbi:hypothetical protein FOZ63_019365 [Perkinsus olseni]|uniref:Uncharacterized protein n=1 Tax=Perkinsus olseni TaxID=32597 RepID=A0A7J6QE16_PEROL|nr:hypothetical protein FOZ63_019365 [Perkinsus olseni]
MAAGLGFGVRRSGSELDSVSGTVYSCDCVMLPTHESLPVMYHHYAMAPKQCLGQQFLVELGGAVSHVFAYRFRRQDGHDMSASTNEAQRLSFLHFKTRRVNAQAHGQNVNVAAPAPMTNGEQPGAPKPPPNA